MNELYYELVVETDDFYELIENFLGDWCDAVIEEDGKLITTYEHNPVDVLDALNIYKKELEEMFGVKFVMSATINEKKKRRLDRVVQKKRRACSNRGLLRLCPLA